MRILFYAFLFSPISLTSGCGSFGFPGVYKIDVKQGNIVTQEMVDQLKPGMTRRQVRFVLGTPMIEDSFNQQRWDYVYLVRNGSEIKEQKRLSVFFEGDELNYFSGNYVPAEKSI